MDGLALKLWGPEGPEEARDSSPHVGLTFLCAEPEYCFHTWRRGGRRALGPGVSQSRRLLDGAVTMTTWVEHDSTSLCLVLEPWPLTPADVALSCQDRQDALLQGCSRHGSW